MHWAHSLTSTGQKRRERVGREASQRFERVMERLWPTIDSAPKDGSVVRTICKRGHYWLPAILYAVNAKFDGDQWVFAEDGRPFSPQPTHWEAQEPSQPQRGRDERLETD